MDLLRVRFCGYLGQSNYTELLLCNKLNEGSSKAEDSYSGDNKKPIHIKIFPKYILYTEDIYCGCI